MKFSGCLAAAAWAWLAPGLLDAAPAFTPESGIRVSAASPQAVVYFSSAAPFLRLYYSRFGFLVQSATSTDGLTWSEEPGIRVFGSSISCAIMDLTTYYRMIYTDIVYPKKFYVVRSARSSNGLDWTLEAGTKKIPVPDNAYIGGVRVSSTTSNWRLYYLQDPGGGADPVNFELRSATSTDQGVTWGASPDVRVPAHVGQFSLGRLTNGKTRLFYTSPLGSQNVDRNVSSRISPDGLSFATEAGVRISTGFYDGYYTSIAAYKFNNFQWRLYYGYQGLTGDPNILSAVTASPEPQKIDPKFGYNDQTASYFAISGEVFSTGTIAIELGRSGESNIAAASIKRPDDMNLTGAFNLLGRAPGSWDVIVTHPDGSFGRLKEGYSLEIREGYVTITDNLFKPKEGEKAKIDVTIFWNGHVQVDLFSMNGQHIKNLLNETLGIGTRSLFWSGDTELGNTVASGVYFLRAVGPVLNKTEKIIVVK